MTDSINIESVIDTIRKALKEKNTPWLDTEFAADYIGCAPGTLKTWRARGEGPRYHLINGKSVRYHVDDLDAFVRGEDNR